MKELFISNVNGIKKSFPWQEPMIKRLSALIFTLEGKTLDAKAIVEAHGVLKSNTGMFSSLRGNLSVLIATMAAMTDDPAARIAAVQEVYALMKGHKFRSSDYLAAASYEIAANTPHENYAQMAAHTREIFLALRANNRFLIGADDYVYAAMMALAGMDANTAADRTKHLFGLLRADFPFFTSRSCLLHLAQIMALGGRDEQCVLKLNHLNRTLRAHKIRLDRSMVLPSLGILSALDTQPDSLADEIRATVEFLRAQKGFGRMSVMEAELNMYAVAFIVGTSLAKTAASNTITNMLIAQQTAMMVGMMAAISASTAAASRGC